MYGVHCICTQCSIETVCAPPSFVSFLYSYTDAQ
jgi:hypothetical protein